MTDSSEFPFPAGFRERMQRLLGDTDFAAFAASYHRPFSHALRVNTLKLRTEEFENLAEYALPGADLTPVPWCPEGRYYNAESRPGKHPYHEAGLYYIQEPSAMCAAAFSGAEPGERILDLCAAPGGKTTQLAAMMQGCGLLVANEIMPQRARILSQNVERMGIRNTVVTNMEPEALAERFPDFFDRILVDAPCSGEGMFRKEEAALTGWSMDNIRLCADRQAGILDCAAQMLCDGGTLVYSTCTFAPEENEGSIGAFLHRHPEFHVVPVMGAQSDSIIETVCVDSASGSHRESGIRNRYGFAPARPDWSENSADLPEIAGAVRLWPHLVRGEGHFLCVLKKDGEAARKVCSDRFPAADQESQKIFRAFCEDAVSGEAAEKLNTDPNRIIRFGEELYLLPDRLSMKGLKVLRPGLDLGTVRKGRFEPSHALALALCAGDFRRTFDLSLKPRGQSADECQTDRTDRTAINYLKGGTLTMDSGKFMIHGLQGSSGEETAAGTCMKSGRKVKKSGAGSQWDPAAGWTVVTVDGYPIGWAKVSGNILKNHYPKGLRWM